MKKRGLHILRAVIFLLIIALFIGINYKDKEILKEEGTFEELILDKYLDAAVEKEFDELRINKDLNTENTTYMKSKDIYIKSDDINKINELLSKFNEYELIEYHGDIQEGRRYNNYNIYFRNSHSMEWINIMLEGDKHIEIYISTLVTTEDKKTKTTTFKHKGTLKRYEITNASIDMEYLDELFDSLNER